MGLNFETSDGWIFGLPYSTFYDLREEVMKIAIYGKLIPDDGLTISYDDTPNCFFIEYWTSIRHKIPNTPESLGIMDFVNHSDCDGIWTRPQTRRMYKAFVKLKEIYELGRKRDELKKMENFEDYYDEFLNMFSWTKSIIFC